jgi:uncharacterized membrane protein YphA (DoxX/SURF4 family)
MSHTPSRTHAESFARDLHWVSLLLRAAIGSLFLIAGLTKIPGGIAGTVSYYEGLFQHSLLPSFLVTAHASAIMFVELGLGAWLLSGYRLRAAWKAAALVLASLAIGMMFAGKYDVASDNYVYVALALGGLVTSRFDRWVLQHASETEPASERNVSLGTELGAR